MRISDLHIGLRVRHPQHGEGTVKGLTETAAQVQFESGPRTLDATALNLEADGIHVTTAEGTVPLSELLREAAREALIEHEHIAMEDVAQQLGLRWKQGALVMRPADASLQAKELPLEAFFHKIVMIRDNLRVLEQKLNAHPGLSDADKVAMQQYVTRCYGTLTSFNVLFKDKSQQFVGAGS